MGLVDGAFTVQMIDGLLRKWGVDPEEFVGGIKKAVKMVETFDNKLQNLHERLTAVELTLENLCEKVDLQNGDIIPAGTGAATDISNLPGSLTDGLCGVGDFRKDTD